MVNLDRAKPAVPATQRRKLLWLAGSGAKVLGIFLALWYSLVNLNQSNLGTDSHAYWLAWRGAMYTGGVMARDAYLYSPAFAEVIRPLTLLPWPVFVVLWSVFIGIVLAWLLAPLRWWAIPLWLVGLPEVVSGNIFILLAVVAVLGLRHRWVWAFAALTKVTLCLGPVWFAVRGEWRNLGISLGVTGAVALLSWAIAPHLWVEWFNLLGSQADRSKLIIGAAYLPPPIYRLPVAIMLVAWGAVSDRRWVLPVGMVLASPVLWLGTCTMLAALPRLHHRSMPRAAAEVLAMKKNDKSLMASHTASATFGKESPR